MDAPLSADHLAALIRQALTMPVESACVVYVDAGEAGYVHCTARIDRDGDVIITPVVPS